MKKITVYLQIQTLRQKNKQKDKKMKELEQHLSLTLQQQATNSQAQQNTSKTVSFSGTDGDSLDPQSDNRGFFSRRKSQRQSISGDTMKMKYDDLAEDKYVSQTCSVM